MEGQFQDKTYVMHKRSGAIFYVHAAYGDKIWAIHVDEENTTPATYDAKDFEACKGGEAFERASKEMVRDSASNDIDRINKVQAIRLLAEGWSKQKSPLIKPLTDSQKDEIKKSFCAESIDEDYWDEIFYLIQRTLKIIPK